MDREERMMAAVKMLHPTYTEISALRLRVAELTREARVWLSIAQDCDRQLKEATNKYVDRIRRARAELRVHRSPEMTDLERIHLRCKDLLDSIPEM